MVFSSTTFLFYFLPFVLSFVGLGYIILHPFLSEKKLTQFINAALLAFSLIFYFWGEGTQTWILILSITITFLSGLALAFASNRNTRTLSNAAAIIGIFGNLTMLGWFKYANFGYEIFNALFPTNSNTITQIALPLGISFYSFQSISYLLDIYWKKIPACKNPIDFGCYITFFPQLIAGPIVRFKDIQSEIDSRNINLNTITDGVSLFIIGLSKKVLIANPTGKLVDDLFSMRAAELSTTGCWLAAIAYSIQILFDFSGYSDMAIGLARIFGIHIPTNFNNPYRSTSMRQFWRNWHISLSSWFRDYLYIPLGGNKYGPYRTLANLFIVFIACGLWHGANYTFILWGLLHGTFLCVEHFSKSENPNKRALLGKTFGTFYTLLIVFSSWILFRSESIEQAGSFYYHMFYKIEGLNKTTLPLTIYSYETQIALFSGLAISLIKSGPISFLESNKRAPLSKKVILLALLALSSLYIAISSYNPFIYFRF